MFIWTYDNFGGLSIFFYLSIGYDSLKNYFETNFSLWKHYQMDLAYLDNLLPWEKDAYVIMLLNWIDKEKLRLQQQVRR